ncbi:MAG: T9SS type A sorting domain-containing protein [Bacteroidetes bacterium]|nr:MAG: T9SS type A sorting domain-containing protein [Bacteroidota bacterium]
MIEAKNIHLKPILLLTFVINCWLPKLGYSQALEAGYRAKHQNIYWYYRYRLREAFTIIGDDEGNCIPIVERNDGATSNSSNHTKATYASETLVQLGWYLGVLATEYRLLKNNQEWVGLEQTKTELYHALKTVHRMDYYGTCNWSGLDWNSGTCGDANPNPIHGACQLDGFLVRHDVPENYYTASQSNRMKINSHNDFFNMAGISDRRYDDRYYPSSNDSDIHLIMGLYLVYKLCNDETNGSDIDGNNIQGAPYLRFSTRAKEQIARIIRYIAYHNWRLERPDGEDVPEGCNAYAWARPYHVILQDIGYSIPSYQNPSIGQRLAWQSMKDQINPAVGTNDNAHMALTLAALSDSWVNAIQNNVTRDHIVNLSEAHNWGDFYPLLHSVLYPGSFNSNEEGKVEASLNRSFATVPCTGPRFYGAHTGIPPWRASRRYVQDEEYQEHGNDVNRGNYAGLDYMLLHNLYRLKSGLNLQYYEDHINRLADWTFTPAPNAADPTQVLGFESVTASTPIWTGRVIEMKGGFCVDLIPGFEIEAGADVLIHTGKFDCDQSFGYRSSSNNIESNASRSLQAFENYELQSFEESDLKTNSEILSDEEFQLYPNPNEGSFYIQRTDFSEVTAFEVTNLMGQIVHEGVLTQEKESIKLDDHLSGIYLVKIYAKNELRTFRMWIK